MDLAEPQDWATLSPISAMGRTDEAAPFVWQAARIRTLAASDATQANRMEGHAAPRSGLPAPVVLGVATLHIVMVVSLAWLSQSAHVSPVMNMAIPVIFMPVAQEPARQDVASSTLPTPSIVERATLAPLPSLSLPPSPQGQLPLVPRHMRRATALPSPHIPRDQAPPLSSPAASPRPVIAPVPAVPAAPSSGNLQALADWEARVRQAVQNALIYPASARLLQRQGNAQVRFDYDRGTVDKVTISQSSHFDLLDSAALAAVTHAIIPAPPAELQSQARTMLVWVQFKLLSD